MSGALDGIRVLDLSRVLAGPYCTMMLGDLGAEIIKIEQPGIGDDTRRWGPPWAGGESAYYFCANRNKKSVTLNLKDERARDVLRGLARQSDIVVENFKVGTLDRMEIGYETMSAENPGLIWCSITGYGQDGPYADRAGYDFVAQGEGGIMSVTGEVDGEPMKVGIAVVDITTALVRIECHSSRAARPRKYWSRTAHRRRAPAFGGRLASQRRQQLSHVW